MCDLLLSLRFFFELPLLSPFACSHLALSLAFLLLSSLASGLLRGLKLSSTGSSLLELRPDHGLLSLDFVNVFNSMFRHAMLERLYALLSLPLSGA